VSQEQGARSNRSSSAEAARCRSALRNGACLTPPRTAAVAAAAVDVKMSLSASQATAGALV